MRKLRVLLIGLALASPALAGSCREGFAVIYGRKPAAPSKKVFDIPTFEKAKAFFADKLARGERVAEGEIEALGLSRPALALALAEVAAERAGTSGEMRIQFAGAKGDVKRQERALARLKFEGEFGWDDIENFVEDFYAAANYSHNPYPYLPRILSNRLPTPSADLLRARLQKTIWTQDLTHAVEALGLLRTPGAKEKFYRWLHRHPNWSELVYSGALNTFTYTLLGYPLHIPRLRPTRALRIDPALVERARREGFDAIYPELKRRYGYLAQFETAWSAARTTVYRASLGVIVYVLHGVVKDHPYLADGRFWAFFFKYGRAKEEDAERRHRETCDVDRLRREQFLSFKDSFNLDEGPFEEPLPNPWDPDYEERAAHFPPQYRMEADDTWRLLLAMTPEEFKCPDQSAVQP